MVQYCLSDVSLAMLFFSFLYFRHYVLGVTSYISFNRHLRQTFLEVYQHVDIIYLYPPG